MNLVSFCVRIEIALVCRTSFEKNILSGEREGERRETFNVQLGSVVFMLILSLEHLVAAFTPSPKF